MIDTEAMPDIDAPIPYRLGRVPLTAAQEAIYRFAYASVERQDGFPTIREFMAEFGIGTTNGVVSHLQKLVKKGWLTHAARGSAKCYRLTGLRVVLVPTEAA